MPGEFDKAKARERCEVATPGPWHSGWSDPESADDDEWPLISGPQGKAVVAGMWWDGPRGACLERDAAFIAHAREDLPAALDELDKAHATIERQRALLRDLADMHVQWGVAQCLCDRRDDSGRFQAHYANCPRRLAKRASALLRDLGGDDV